MRGLSIVFSLLIILLGSCSFFTRSNVRVFLKSHYKVIRIKEKKSVYLIYAEKGDSTYLIMSSKDNPPINQDATRIKVGHYYNFELKKVFPHDSIFGVPMIWNLGIVGIGLPNNEEILPKRNVHYSIYRANNLFGRYLIKPQNRIKHPPDSIISQYGL